MPDGVPGDEASTGEAAVDPRYDPAFQRGYSGDVTSAPRGQSTLRRTAAVNPARPAPIVTPPPSLDISAPPARVVTPEAVDGGFAPAEVGPGSEGSFAPVSPRELARNPFVVALAALAAVLIVAGAVWAVQGFSSIAKNGGTRNEVEFWAAQTMSFGAPLAIIVGLALVGVLLAQFARAWQRGQR